MLWCRDVSCNLTGHRLYNALHSAGQGCTKIQVYRDIWAASFLLKLSAEPLFVLPGLPLKFMEVSPLHVPVALGTSLHASHTTAEPRSQQNRKDQGQQAVPMQQQANTPFNSLHSSNFVLQERGEL